MRILFSFGEFGGLLAYLFAGKYRRLARRNLAIALGREQTERELGRLTRRHFQRLGANLLCTLKFGRMPIEKIAACVTLENENILHEELRAGRGAVVALSHLGSWELFAQICPREFGYAPIGTVYQRLGNRSIDADVQRQRARTGVQLFDRSAGFHGAIELLRRGGGLGNSGRSTRWGSRSLDAVLRTARFDHLPAGAAREADRQCGPRGRDLHDGAGAVADGIHAAPRSTRRFGGSNHQPHQ